MSTRKRTGLGRGIGALIPTKPAGEDRPVDVFFPDTRASGRVDAESAAAAVPEQVSTVPAKATKRKRAAAVEAPAVDPRGAVTEPDEPALASTDAARGAVEGLEATARPQPQEDIAAESRPARGRSRARAADAAASGPDADDAAAAPTTGSGRATMTAAAPPLAETDEASSADVDAEAPEGELLPITGAHLAELDPSRIAPNLRQPRTEFDEELLDELITSVREFGVLQPIVVRPIPADHPASAAADYELIMGERRLRASKAAGLERIPAVVRETADDEMLRDALLENIHRAQLNPLEEASAYQQLLDDFGITQEELARRIGRSRPQISNTMRLLRLPVEVQRRVAAGVLSAGHARAILSVGEPAAMTQLADKIVNEDLSVRAAEAAAQRQAPRTTPRSSSRSEPGGLTAYLDDAAERLGDRLNTRVRVSLRKTKGQIVVDFASVNDLNRILEDLGVELPR